MRQAKFNKPLTVSLTEEQYLKIKEITDREHISMAEWVRRVLDRILTGNQITGGSNGNGKEMKI